MFILAFAVGDEGVRPSSFSGRSGALLALLIVGVLANLLAWRWQMEGATVALVALGCMAAVEFVALGRLPGAWFFVLLGVPALLHLVAAILGSRPGS